MKKIKRIFKQIIEFFKGMRISTIYKLVGVILFISIMYWIGTMLFQDKVFTKKVQNEIILNGTITNKGIDYIIVQDDATKEYLIKNVNQNNYTIGSLVKVSINSIVEEGYNLVPTTITSNNISIINDNIKNKNADQYIISYFKDTEKMFLDTNKEENIKENFKDIIDFLFYDGKINNYTLKDLSASAKLEILKLVLSIDKNIEDYLPGYKETITMNNGKIYTGIKNKAIAMYLELTAKICKYDNTLCNTSKTNFQELKDTYSITWESIKNLIINDTYSLNEWYAIYSGNTN